jgi:hypothetical protein
MKLIVLLGLLASFNSFAQEAEECLNEAVQVAIALKISVLAEGDCTSLTREKYIEIEETRNAKKRFLKQAIQALNNGNNVPSRFFQDLDDNSPDVLLDKKSICAVVKKKSEQGSKEMMKDCSEKTSGELLQLVLGNQQELDKISEISLAHSCERVEKLKKQTCKDSKVVYYSLDSSAATDKREEPVKIRSGSSSSGSSSASAREQ